MLRPSSLGLVYLLLAGCVVTIEDPRPAGSTSQYVSVALRQPDGTEKTEHPPPMVIEHPAPSETPRSVPDCPVFQLPPTRVIPKMADIASPDITTQQEVEVALATYINDLKTYIAEQRERLVRRHETYLDQCG